MSEDRNSEMVAVPRSVIADLYRFFHHAWEGQGRVTDEGSHGKDLLDWRQVMSTYHRGPPISASASPESTEHDGGISRD
jgi:hypothetical protein